LEVRWLPLLSAFSLKKHQINAFFSVFFNNFDVLVLKMKKKIILILF